MLIQEKKLRVALMVAGFPGPDNPTHGLFNKRAALALAPLVDLTVIQFRLWKPGRKRISKYNENGYRIFVICVPFIPLFPNTFSTVNALLMSFFSESLIREEIKNFDIIHAVNATLAFIPARWKKHANFKLVVQSIGSDLNSEIPAIIHQPCVQWLKKAIDAATFNSKQLSIQYHKFLGKPPVERIIYRGVDLSNYSAGINSKYKDGNKLTFLFIGGLPVYRNFLYKENTKGGHTLMNAWKEFEKGKYGNMEVKLIFAGPGSVKKISTDWHRNLKYPEKVEMPGILNKEELAKAYQQADIVIIPSMEEGLPNAGMEAAASGCALIGTNVGGIPEIIINGKTGILIEPGNEPQLVKAIETYISDPGMSARHGAQGRTLMQLFFKHDHFAPAYVQLYHELL